ncbi:MAG: class I SAM-dependent methyltransferase [Chloroflexi bacterium]|nr:class I SAM-dependent methyltransferase [Chloroflexota bacterium]MYD66571.1 class I SAM-dependent methyltransferase [Chloroflexota bacterium]
MLDAHTDPFAPIARFYDLDLEGFNDDLGLYMELVGGRDVLELGCGTGRVAVPLAAAGSRVTGVDISPAMLAAARERAEGLPLRLVEGDMRTLDLGEPFGAVLVPLGGLQHMTTTAEVAAALATVARHLAPGGQAVVDVEAPHPDDWLPGPRPVLQHWTRELPHEPGSQGGTVTKLVAVEGRPVESLREVTYHFDVQPPEGPLQRVTQQFTLRIITAGEIELAARLAGLHVAAWHGDYDGAPPREGDDRLIAVLEHAAEPGVAA